MVMHTSIDMTIPLWGILGTGVVIAYHVLNMHFEVRQLKRSMRSIKRHLGIEDEDDD